MTWRSAIGCRLSALLRQRARAPPTMAAVGLRSLGPLLVPRGAWRGFSAGADGEERVSRVLREKFPRASAIRVVDISGGCGAMYEIHIESEEFREKRMVQQHQMVNQALSEEIKSMHGLRIFTSVPKS